MAQREAGLSDAEYREALALFGATSCKDAHLTDEYFDKVLAYFEAICWRKRESGATLPRARVFRQQGYWQQKNFGGTPNSRERFTREELAGQIVELEEALAEAGKGAAYFYAIQERVMGADRSARALASYAAALRRNLAARERKALA